MNRANINMQIIIWVTLIASFSVGQAASAAVPWPTASPESQRMSSTILRVAARKGAKAMKCDGSPCDNPGLRLTPSVVVVVDNGPSNRPPHAQFFPGKRWAEKSPSQVGLDPGKLNVFKKATKAKEGCVIRHGYLVYKWGDASKVRRWASAYKPVNSTMLLFALKEGLIDSVDDPVRPWVRKVFSGKDLIGKDRTMTFRHLCNMTSGYALPETPGDAWGYNDRGIALKRMLLYGYKKWGGGPYGVFGEDSDVAQIDPDRLGALQFEDDPNFKSGSGKLSVRDFARIGWFWHNKGNWKGRRLLPRSYFDEYMKPQVPAGLPRTQGGENDYLDVWPEGGGTDQTPHGQGEYGFNWWFNPGRRLLKDVPSDIIHANGNWNKRALTIFPSLDMVVVWNEGPWGQDGEGSDVIPELNNMLKKLAEAVVDTGAK